MLRNRYVLIPIILLVGLAGMMLASVSAQESYTVEYGDVLDVIAARYNVSVACIAEASGLESPHVLRPGDVLTIPANCPPYDGLALGSLPAQAQDAGQGGGGSAQTLSAEGTYVVQPRDVLDLIGAAFDVSPACIAETNNLTNPNRIFPGDELVIDTSCPPYDGVNFVLDRDTIGQGGGAAAPRASSGSGYVVVSGDILDLIAAYYNVSVSCLAETNNITDPQRIFPGDELVIDTSCPPYDGLSDPGRIRNRRFTEGAGGAGTGGTGAADATATPMPTVAAPTMPPATTATLQATPILPTVPATTPTPEGSGGGGEAEPVGTEEPAVG